ncbi:sensor histidine kinase [Vibrio sp. TRT 21S02]|uniref:sensor histidine kinase n=1 Tax=unclassified Vibrio TaxID=2614977 RepID=UPI00349F4B01
MLKNFLSSTQTLTGRLALFFGGVSCVVGLVAFLIFFLALQWSEDRVGERRILIDRNEAVNAFLSGAEGKISLDTLTDAYNDLSLLPEPYNQYLQKHDSFLGEVGLTQSPESHMIYKGHYFENGQKKDIVLLSEIDQVEFHVQEMLVSASIVILFVVLLMFIFGALLYRLSKRLIEPINELAAQLETQTADTSSPFVIQPQAAHEFQLLTQRLNQYRQDLNQALKREQAFARYASHELRTPLTVVKGATKLITRDDISEFQTRQVKRINDSTDNMIAMVDALLAIVRYERNVSEQPLRSVSLSEIQAIVDSNAPQAQDKGIQIVMHFEQAPKLFATPAVLSMVIGNLLRNAVAAAQNGIVDLHINAQELTVIDDGHGLVTQADPQGHGLGLMIVEDLCLRYGWQFTLNEHPQRGCIATIRF